jgi:hypothetical protein
VTEIFSLLTLPDCCKTKTLGYHSPRLLAVCVKHAGLKGARLQESRHIK